MPLFLTADRLRALLDRNDSEAIRDALAAVHPHTVAEILEPLSDAEVWAILCLDRPEDAAETLSHLPLDRQVELAASRDTREVAALVAAMPADDRADLVKHLPEDRQADLLALMSERLRLETERLVQYPEDTVGAVMSTEVAAIEPHLTAGQALAYVRRVAPRKETIYYIYVIDAQGRLGGFVSLKDLILADTGAAVGDLMHRDVIYLHVGDPREVAARQIKDYDLLALPVINGNDKLVGIVTVDDVLDVEEDEATIDFHRMAPIGLMATSLKEAGIGMLFRARVPWLLALVFMNIFSGAGIAYFEDTLAASVALVFFLPLLIDSGGNAGSQAATLMVRALATGDVRLRDWLRLLGKEVSVALTLGVSMALAVALVATFRAPDILVPVALTMVATVLFGSLVGMSLPFLLTRLRLDPATASAPLITSLADIGGVLIYFSIATWWLLS
jgi:magnesium transporter